MTVAGSSGSDAVTEAQQWLVQQGIQVPEPDAVAHAAVTRTGTGSTASADDTLAGTRAEGGTEPRRGRARDRGTRRGTRTERPGDPGSPENPAEVARGVVLRKLTGSARSRHELDQALRAKQVPQAVADEVLDRMEEVGLVDDAAFARDWVESRQQRRQLSRRALRHELQTKGVDRDEIEEALSVVDLDDEYEAARALAERKGRSMSGLTREVRYRRLAGALARRGFSGGVTGRVLSEVLGAEPG